MAIIRVSVTPNPFVGQYNATLDMAVGTYTLTGNGGVTFTAYVDALSDTIMLSVQSSPDHPLSLTALIVSPRPDSRQTYTLPLNCAPTSTAPDFFPPPLSFLPNSISIIHTNNASADGNYFRATLSQQGLAGATIPDPLDGRMWGVSMVGWVSTPDSPILRLSPTMLSSSTPASSFYLRVTALVAPDAAGDTNAFLSSLAASTLAGPESFEERKAVSDAWWVQFWERSYIYVPSFPRVTAAYLATRYLQSIQSRGHNIPIKFNGQLFMNAVGNSGVLDIDFRQWGQNFWWQNTRLPYGNMLASGDFEEMTVVLEWLLQQLPFLKIRSEHLLPPPAQGIYTTEVTTLWGSYAQGAYEESGKSGACLPRPEGYPSWLSVSGWTQFDFFGNAAGGEGSQMILDFFVATGNSVLLARYLEFVTLSLDFAFSYYTNRSSTGKLTVWPSQVLETWWCYPYPPSPTNCCVNDLPTVAALTSLTQRLLALPEGTLTPQQVERYTQALALLPTMPTSNAAGTVYAPALTLSPSTHNQELPELYGIHPFRLFTKGREIVGANNLTNIGRETWSSLPLSRYSKGWYYGGIAAALLGLTSEAWADIIERASEPPAAGYRWPWFAQHYQDFPPSSDHFANLNSALQYTLIQSGEEGVTNSTLVIFPAWNCSRDVQFKLWGAGGTFIEVVLTNGSLSAVVTPPERAKDVRWGGCM